MVSAKSRIRILSQHMVSLPCDKGNYENYHPFAWFCKRTCKGSETYWLLVLRLDVQHLVPRILQSCEEKSKSIDRAVRKNKAIKPFSHHKKTLPHCHTYTYFFLVLGLLVTLPRRILNQNNNERAQCMPFDRQSLIELHCVIQYWRRHDMVFHFSSFFESY